MSRSFNVCCSLVLPVSLATVIDSFVQRRMWSSVSCFLLSHCWHLPLTRLSRSCCCLRVAVILFWNFTILVRLYGSSFLIDWPITSHAILSKVRLFQSGCFFNIRCLSCAEELCVLTKFRSHVIGVESRYSWIVGGGSMKCGCVCLYM